MPQPRIRPDQVKRLVKAMLAHAKACNRQDTAANTPSGRAALRAQRQAKAVVIRVADTSTAFEIEAAKDAVDRLRD